MNDHKFPAAEINKAIAYWQERLGLKNWEINWSIGGVQSHTVTKENEACVFYLCGGRTANIEFNPFCTRWKHSLKHEMLEILLADLQKMVDPKYDEWQVEAVKHSIIRRLEKILK